MTVLIPLDAEGEAYVVLTEQVGIFRSVFCVQLKMNSMLKKKDSYFDTIGLI